MKNCITKKSNTLASLYYLKHILVNSIIFSQYYDYCVSLKIATFCKLNIDSTFLIFCNELYQKTNNHRDAFT